MLPKPGVDSMISPIDSSSSNHSTMSGSDKQISPVNSFSCSAFEKDRQMKDKCSYLNALLTDKKQLACFPPGVFKHVDRVLDEAGAPKDSAGLEDLIFFPNLMNSPLFTANNTYTMNMMPLNGFPNSLSQPLHRGTTGMAQTVQTLNSTNSQLNFQCSTSRANALNTSALFGNKQSLMPTLSGESDTKTKERCQYLQQLINDRKESQKFPTIFQHVERLLDEEIVRVRSVLFQSTDSTPLELPPPQGPVTSLTEKVYVPVKDYPEYNFVGRILGPRGLTAKQLEQDAKCKIMVRGKASMRDKKKEEANRGKPNWEHLNEDLHVLVTVEDTENRARIKIKKAVEEVKKLLIPAEGEDDLKKKQLMELAIINGTYRDFSNQSAQPRLITSPQMLSIPGMRSPTPGQPPGSILSAPIFTRLPNGQTIISNGAAPPPPPLMTSPEGTFYYTTPLEYPYAGLVAAPGPSLLEYSFHDQALLGATPGAKIVRPRADTRVHPYQRSPGSQRSPNTKSVG